MRLITFLEKENIPLSAFATKANLKTSYLSQIKNLKKRPSPEVALLISNATGGAVTVMELLFPSQSVSQGEEKA